MLLAATDMHLMGIMMELPVNSLLTHGMLTPTK